MISFSAVTNFGQISPGELLVIEKKNGVKFIAVAKRVIGKGSESEEVVLSVSRNDYFIVSMLLDGTSWVKNVTRLHGVEVTNLTNTMREFVRH